jgi:cytoskeleton protein RodZ
MDSEEAQHTAVGEPAGKQLRRAREKLGLSLKDVANAQHLRVSIIQSIEDAEYDQIDSELFLKGYVRAYAKQVGADADELIQTLNVELEPIRREREQLEQENPLVDIERRRRKKRQLAKGLVIILILGLLGVGAWKLVLEPSMVPDNAQPGASAGSATDSEEGQAPAGNVDPGLTAGPDINSVEQSDSAASMSGPEVVDSPERADSPEPFDSSELEGNPEALNSEDPVDSQAPVESSGPAENDASAQDPVLADLSGQPPAERPIVETVEPIAEPDPVFEESAQPGAVAPATQLQMSFVADCWVQVTDSSGARLVASLQRAGDQIRVSGRAPFDVVIGAVDAVESVSFGGDSVDLERFRVVNNRTEFTLTL